MLGLSPPEQGVVVDIQGVLRRNRYVLTDPAIHCTCANRRYGDTNLGQDGIDSCFSGHTCNAVCHALSLPVPA